MVGVEVDISPILEQMEDVKIEPPFAVGSQDPHLFASGIVLARAQIAAIGHVATYEAHEHLQVAKFKLIKERALRLKEEFGIKINRDQPYPYNIFYDDFHYGSAVAERGIEILETAEGAREREFSHSLISRFDEIFATIPQDGQAALTDFADWNEGNGQYTGKTGKKLEAALGAKLITQDEYRKIIAARASGQQIITNPLQLEAKTRMPYFSESTGVWREMPGYMHVWAIAPQASSRAELTAGM